jgi:hypothetical protein
MSTEAEQLDHEIHPAGAGDDRGVHPEEFQGAGRDRAERPDATVAWTDSGGTASLPALVDQAMGVLHEPVDTPA